MKENILDWHKLLFNSEVVFIAEFYTVEISFLELRYLPCLLY